MQTCNFNLVFLCTWQNKILTYLNKTLKISTSLNAFKHNIKLHYFKELKKKRDLIAVSVILVFQSKYIHLNLIINMYYFKSFFLYLFYKS